MSGCGSYSCAPARRDSPEPRRSDPVLDDHPSRDRPGCAAGARASSHVRRPESRRRAAFRSRRCRSRCERPGDCFVRLRACGHSALWNRHRDWSPLCLPSLHWGRSGQRSQRGLGLALAGLLLGLVDVVGWIASHRDAAAWVRPRAAGGPALLGVAAGSALRSRSSRRRSSAP